MSYLRPQTKYHEERVILRLTKKTFPLVRSQDDPFQLTVPCKRTRNAPGIKSNSSQEFFRLYFHNIELMKNGFKQEEKKEE